MIGLKTWASKAKAGMEMKTSHFQTNAHGKSGAKNKRQKVTATAATELNWQQIWAKVTAIATEPKQRQLLAGSCHHCCHKTTVAVPSGKKLPLPPPQTQIGVC